MKTNLLKLRRVMSATLLVLLLTVAGLTKAFALDFTEGIFNYTVNDDGTTVTVTGLVNGTNYYGAVNIPDEVTYLEHTYSVTKIAASAFQNCVGVTSATIPSSMTFIGIKAFRGCTGLVTLNYNAVNCSLASYEYSFGAYDDYHWLYSCYSLATLNIGNGVQTIPDYFVYSYSSNMGGYYLTGSVIIPNTVTSIGEYAFGNCWNIGSVRIGSSVSSIGTYAFASCSKLTSVVLPSSMTTISDYTFSGCSLLSSVTIPNTIVTIGSEAFKNCNKLTSLSIPNSVVSIGSSAFYGCSSLTSVSFGESLASIGASAFYGCSNITEIVIPSSVVSIGASAFYNCSRLTSLTLGSSVTAIYGTAFYGCTNLTTVTIPASVTSIGVDVFGNCTNLGQITVASGNTVYDSRNNCNAIIETAANRLVVGCKNTVIPNTVTIIGNRAFYSCTALSGTLNLPNSVTMIEPYAFYGCIGLSGALNIPNSVVFIEESAFEDCTGINSVTIPSSMTFIGIKAFRGCTGLITLNYNAVNCSLASYEYSFGAYDDYHWLYSCYSLATLNIGNGVQTIPDYFVFAYNSDGGGCHLTGSVIIPNTVTSIGEYAFGNCWNIGSVRIGSSVSSIGTHAFYNCSKLTSVVLPSSMTSISDYTFSGCSLLNSVVIPNTIVTIGSNAFNNCNKLTSLSIPNSVASIGSSAFYGCSSITSVSLGENVASLGTSSFYNCSNIASMRVLAVNTPAVLSNAFYGVPTDIPVEVPCHTLSTYQSASGWSRFTNMHENCNASYEIVVSANPAEGGIVIGAGTYSQDEMCTVSATAHTGYSFVNWTEYGMVVSTDAVYSFNVGDDRNLVANFEFSGALPTYWTPVSANYPDNMALYGVISIEGVEQYSNQLEVGAFCGNECRGAAIAAEFSLTNRYLVIMTVFGDYGDQITFKLYDHSIEQELNYTVSDAITFDMEGLGTPVEPYTIEFVSPVVITAIVQPIGSGTVMGTGEYAPGATCTLVAYANTGYQFKNWTLNGTVVSTSSYYTFEATGNAQYVANFSNVHTRALASGWNWYSTYIEQNGIDGLTILENSLGNDGIRIQGRNGMVDYIEYEGVYYWYGTLETLANEQMYKIRTNENCNAIMVGDVTSPTSHPITINNGWNWIGFPNAQSVSVETAMSGFTPKPNDVIKGRNSTTTYVSYNGTNMWYGTLNTLEPGHGYMYKSNNTAAKTLTFQVGKEEDIVENITSENNIFTPNDAEFANNMLITAVVEMNGNELRSDEYELAAFVGEECRGSVKLMYVEPFDKYIAFLLVFGDEADDIQFVLTNGNETIWSDNMMVYTADAIAGTLTDPATICFGTLGLNDNVLANTVVYPNPSNGVFSIQGEGITKIEVLNIYGQVIMSSENEGDIQQVDLSEYSAGVYMLRVFTDNGTVSKQIVKK